jgi:CRISPR-associated protein (TIGR03984 family)
MSNFKKIPSVPAINLREWITKQMSDNKLEFLLAFADDGVIWGRMDNGILTIAREASEKEDKRYVELRDKTLQRAYAFNQGMEVRLFCDESNHWKAYQVQDVDEKNVIVESQILWGDKLDENDQPIRTGFMRLLADRKGIDPQVYPIKDGFDPEKDCVRLKVHHVVDFNEDTGEAYIKFSRLAGLSAGKKEMEV